MPLCGEDNVSTRSVHVVLASYTLARSAGRTREERHEANHVDGVVAVPERGYDHGVEYVYGILADA